MSSCVNSMGAHWALTRSQSSFAYQVSLATLALCRQTCSNWTRLHPCSLILQRNINLQKCHACHAQGKLQCHHISQTTSYIWWQSHVYDAQNTTFHQMPAIWAGVASLMNQHTGTVVFSRSRITHQHHRAPSSLFHVKSFLCKQTWHIHPSG